MGWSHRGLIDYMRHIGYQASDVGVCYGYVHMGIQAVLTEKMVEFDARLEKMEKDQASGFNLTTAQRGKEGITPFLDGVELHYQPQLYTDLFEEGKAPIGQNALTSAPFVMSTQVRKQGGITDNAGFSGVYKPDELIQYFESLEQSIKSADPSYNKSIAFSLGNAKHIIGIGYDPKKNQWIFMDANKLPTQYLHNAKEIAAAVQQAFKAPENDKTVTIATKIYAVNENENKAALSAIIDNWLSKQEMKQMHQVNKDKADFTDAQNVSWLFLAARYGDLDAVKKLLKNDINPNQSDKDGFSPLYVAATYGHTEIVKALLNHSEINVNVSTVSNYTPLHIAAKAGHTEIVKELLCHGANPELQTTDYKTPIDLAIESKRYETSSVIADYNQTNRPNAVGETALYIAAKNGELEAVKDLLKNPYTDPNIAAKNTMTPLHIAVQNGHLEVVVELLKHRRIDPNKVEEDLYTPLHLAAQAGNLKMVVELLKHKKTNPDTFSILDETPSSIAAEKGHNEIVQAISNPRGLKASHEEAQRHKENEGNPLFIDSPTMVHQFHAMKSQQNSIRKEEVEPEKGLNLKRKF